MPGCYNERQNKRRRAVEAQPEEKEKQIVNIKKLFAGNKAKGHDVDMTEGGIVKHLIRFSIPLLLGNIFQQLYNTVDSWVVGNYVSDQAFAAVGTVGPIINLLIGLFMGLSTGASVVISQYYGAKDKENVQKSVHTAITVTIILGIVFTVIGISMTPLMLRLMDTPENVMPESTTYLRIYFSGMLGLVLYNMGSGIMRAVGDSTRPFYFLVVSALTNTVLDLLFVLVLKMGVDGVAYATIIAQFVSALLVLLVLTKTDGYCKLSFKKLGLDMKILGKVFKIGVPAALQMAITSFSNIFVQSYINFFGDTCMGGWTAYAKIDQFLLLPMQSISLAATTFVGQNLGVNKVKRAKQGVTKAMTIAVASTLVLMVPVLIAAPSLVEFFNDNPEVVKYGSMLLRLISPFYVFCCINQILAGALRGSGDSRTPMFIMLGCFVVFRQIYLFLMTRFVCNTITVVALGYPAGWLLCSIATYFYFKKSNFEKYRIVD